MNGIPNPYLCPLWAQIDSRFIDTSKKTNIK